MRCLARLTSRTTVNSTPQPASSYYRYSPVTSCFATAGRQGPFHCSAVIRAWHVISHPLLIRFLCRDFHVEINSLSGFAPPSLASKFGAASFNFNCLSNYTTQPWCPLPFLQLQALTDLYTATNGSGWTNKTNWLTGDPCLKSWFGVTCNAPTNTTITYVRCVPASHYA